jgi:methionine biosynthesis protein MetW
VSSAVAYRLHQLHVHRDGAFLVDHGVHYTLKHSPHGSHMQILEAIRPGSRVLDLGCSQGLLARALASKGVRIVGVDRTPESSVSRELEAYHRRDLELPLDIPEERAFDYVVVSDVIEHVKEREQLLRSARRYLKPDGRLLISTPNIAIWFYRLSLAIGRFEYGPRGVLDETHVHLYTRATFRREVERGGFRILRERVTALPFEVVFESTGQSRAVAALSAAYHGCARAWPKLFAYQFIIEAEVTTLLDPDPGPSAS